MTNVSADLRRRFLAGEAITYPQATEEYNVSDNYLATFLRNQRKSDGWVFNVGASADGRKRFTLHRPEPSIDREQWGPRTKKSANIRRRGPDRKPRKRAEKKTVQLPLPQLGATLTVKLLLLNEADGSIKVGLRNGDGTWTAVIDGYVAGSA